MSASDRRAEIVNILILRRHITAGELAHELNVSIRTIHYDIQALSVAYPIYTKQGENGGIFMRDDYRPYVNTLTDDELKTLCEIYRKSEGKQKKTILQIIRKYGPDKLDL